MNASSLRLVAGIVLGGFICSGPLLAGQPDPFAGNNTVYPDAKEWNGPTRTSNYDYPSVAPVAKWLAVRPGGTLTVKTAPQYVAAVKKFIEADMSALVNDPLKWSPQTAGWFDMPWGGQGTPMANGKIDPESGREMLLGSYTGQILQPSSYPSAPPKTAFQNHAVVYYNDVAGYQLGRIWKDPFHPSLADAQFPEGSMVVKVEGVNLTDDEWPILKNSSISHIYRPTPASVTNEPDPTKRVPIVTPLRFLQMAVRVKDSIASPATGWVFIAFAYDTRSRGATPWDRALPVGATWGNDPELAKFPDGRGPNGQLKETWIADGLPKFITDGLGWGGRLAGPLDVGVRHNVMTVSGKRYVDGNSFPASACVSCHGSAQYPFVANLYPSPNMVFPEDGGQFLFFDPGSPLWGQWWQNRPGSQAMTGKGRNGIVGTDYDMMLTFALMRANGSADTDAFIRHRLAGH